MEEQRGGMLFADAQFLLDYTHNIHRWSSYVGLHKSRVAVTPLMGRYTDAADSYWQVVASSREGFPGDAWDCHPFGFPFSSAVSLSNTPVMEDGSADPSRHQKIQSGLMAGEAIVTRRWQNEKERQQQKRNQKGDGYLYLYSCYLYERGRQYKIFFFFILNLIHSWNVYQYRCIVCFVPSFWATLKWTK